MKNKNELVVKSNRLVEASYRLTLAEQRIILFAIVEARRTQTGLSEDNLLTIQAADYAEMFNVPAKQAYEQIKEAGRTLFRRYVVLHEINPLTGKEETVEVRWVSSVRYLDGTGVIRFRFAHDMVPYITRLEAQFTRYKLEKIANMTSVYAVRLYELLIQWGSVGKREIELDWLRKVLMVDENYERLSNFKKWVIDVAVSQINEHSDLTASYTQRKTGRNVTHLTFTFAPKEETKPQSTQEVPVNIHDSPLFRRLRDHGIGVKLATDWIKQDEARVLALVEYVEARAKQGLIKGSTAGYLRVLFETGAEVSQSSFDAGLKAQASEAAEASRLGKQQEAETKRIEAEKRKQERAEIDQALVWFEGLPEGIKKALETEFLAEANSVDAGIFKKKGRDYIGFRLFVKKAKTQLAAS